MQTFLMAALIMLQSDGMIGGEVLHDDFKTQEVCVSSKPFAQELMHWEVRKGMREPFAFVGILCLPDNRKKVKVKNGGYSY